MYCKLVEHVPGQPVRNPQCRICNQNSSNPNRMYFIMFLMAMGRIYNREILWKICIKSQGVMILKIPRILFCELIYSPSLSLDKHQTSLSKAGTVLEWGFLAEDPWQSLGLLSPNQYLRMWLLIQTLVIHWSLMYPVLWWGSLASTNEEMGKKADCCQLDSVVSRKERMSTGREGQSQIQSWYK